jgi:hypothetical protein
MNCKDCKFWKQWSVHPEIKQQHEYGDCLKIGKDQNIFNAYCYFYEEYVEANQFEVHKSFGCVLAERR